MESRVPPLLHEAAPIAAGDFNAGNPRPQLLAQLADVEKAVGGGAQLVDGRTADYYVGQNMTSDVKGKGHLPGARMLAHKDIVDEATGTFLPKGELLAMARDAGIDPAGEAITYCNTGIWAAAPGSSSANFWGTRKRSSTTAQCTNGPRVLRVRCRVNGK
jgi:3-mercaptopyruvate sulfurtransferase SseA